MRIFNNDFFFRLKIYPDDIAKGIRSAFGKVLKKCLIRIYRELKSKTYKEALERHQLINFWIS